ncbi:carboxymuconolactone decarboxylase family protein [Rhizobium sp. BK609]|uniref:carboxymuconolactone decarboxylase family protein n=1 Tax=unclassified Rhizobium TaxID=2613769 RepID=UPI0017EE3986|nr:4-carboxymuconolactone decarboxylase [Rhizobium sp. BK098]MBB3571188.1 4-carboxymuconolactone decarboxylase [Rhizobium sp. BK491]MBB3617916.1 4-carboxymuconolactone decarboxylase [Rhizobium sp. BK609]MBB3683631.1 4-carboxymuconolactone decarboxylase [Rhizobium sp. BK612]
MDDKFFNVGLGIRRAVMGDSRVDKSLVQADDFSRPVQELTTSFAWGQVWGREAELDRRTRSLLTIGMLIALNRQAELQAHIVGGLRNGLTEADIREVVIHSVVYCGFPAALEATRSAQAALQLAGENESQP